jgi:hypothetical protein
MLPFADATGDLVLSAQLLFTSPDQMDAPALLAALRELVRAIPREVRMFALIDTTVAPSRYLDHQRQTAAAEGVVSDVLRVPDEFQRGAQAMMILGGAAVTRGPETSAQ